MAKSSKQPKQPKTGPTMLQRVISSNNRTEKEKALDKCLADLDRLETKMDEHDRLAEAAFAARRARENAACAEAVEKRRATWARLRVEEANKAEEKEEAKQEYFQRLDAARAWVERQ